MNVAGFSGALHKGLIGGDSAPASQSQRVAPGASRVTVSSARADKSATLVGSGDKLGRQVHAAVTARLR